MANKGNGKPSYYRAVWARAFADWKAAVRDRLIWGLILAIITFAVWSVVMSLQQALPGVGVAVVSVASTALLYLLWHRFWAPARIWADDRQTIAELQAQLDARRGVELVPRLAKQNKRIQVLPVPSDGRPDQEATVVWGTLAVTVINHDPYPATVTRLWLRVSDPITHAEIQPLGASDLPSFAGLVEPIKERPLNMMIGARSQQETEEDFCAYYPLVIAGMARQEIASLITLCVTAPGLGTTHCSLGEEFFETMPAALTSMPSEDQQPPTAS